MGSLFELLFNNPFLLFLLIIGLIQAFNRKKDGSKVESEVEPTVEKKEPVPKPLGKMMSKLEDIEKYLVPEEKKAHQPSEKKEKQKEASIQSIQEVQKEQYERLRQQYTRKEDLVKDQASSLLADQKGNEASIREDLSKVSLRSRLTRKGLVESVIMSELLGPPRARKKHHSRY